MKCSAGECERKAVSRGLCDTHRKQRGRGADIRPIGYRPPPRALLPNPGRPGTLLVPLSRGFFAVVDECDRAEVEKFNWQVKPPSETSLTAYAQTGSILLHIFIARLAEMKIKNEVDHRNGDGLDCTRGNLRPATVEQNRQNTRPHRDNKSGLNGVRKSRNKWRAQIQANGVVHDLGTFDSKEDAARAYGAAAERLHGEFARTA